MNIYQTHIRKNPHILGQGGCVGGDGCSKDILYEAAPAKKTAACKKCDKIFKSAEMKFSVKMIK